MPPGFEGLHIFDITNKTNPDLIASVDLQCGSHTQTMIPDLANNRLIVYVGSSSATCQNFDIVEIPLANPAGARLLRQIPTEEHPCHDIGVILGSADEARRARAATASASTASAGPTAARSTTR